MAERAADLVTGLSGGAYVAGYPPVWRHTVAVVRCPHNAQLVTVLPSGIVHHCRCFTVPPWERCR
jgi:hypothetical protein